MLLRCSFANQEKPFRDLNTISEISGDDKHDFLDSKQRDLPEQFQSDKTWWFGFSFHPRNDKFESKKAIFSCLSSPEITF